ncbi:hypothetical protein EGJ27_05810 [Pseudomonas sp. v388]|uniref:hypothetical protein n=1 Tax=Pseudomonas sp. v388 TaxID=2479849 RepID=UPI000F7668AD|nr:hypothetical protein [Pseudomonas sp. v388]RRV09287.1 hypothetical protein EGJ27_05810 [Pseudomonas sp. v388]
MTDIHPASGFITNTTIQKLAKTASAATENSSFKETAPAVINSNGATFSTLAIQLNESAARAASRENSHSSKSLGALAKDIIDRIAGRSYYANRQLHDAEVPNTDDATLLERARQATRFANGTGKNPFAGLSQDDLRLIMYDDSGLYTINERSAAFSENYAQEELWNRAMAQRYVEEYNQTGKSTETLMMILAHYNELPPIEKAQYPTNFAANLTSDDSSAMAVFNILQTQSKGPIA